MHQFMNRINFLTVDDKVKVNLYVVRWAPMSSSWELAVLWVDMEESCFAGSYFPPPALRLPD